MMKRSKFIGLVGYAYYTERIPNFPKPPLKTSRVRIPPPRTTADSTVIYIARTNHSYAN